MQRIRLAKGLSQTQLARAAQVPVGTLRNWERGRRTPLLDTAARVADALGVSLDELAGRTEKPTERKGKGKGAV